MVKGDVIFCATGVTDGDLLSGIIDKGEIIVLEEKHKLMKKLGNKILKIVLLLLVQNHIF